MEKLFSSINNCFWLLPGRENADLISSRINSPIEKEQVI